MKKLFLSVLALAIISVLIGSIAFAGGSKYTLPTRSGDRVSSVVITHAAANVDTIVYTREQALAGLSFFISAEDSMDLDRVTIRRIGNGNDMYPILTVDTLSAFTGATNHTETANPDTTWFATVTLAPLADQYYFIVDWAATIHGITYPTYTVGVQKQYYYKP